MSIFMKKFVCSKFWPLLFLTSSLFLSKNQLCCFADMISEDLVSSAESFLNPTNISFEEHKNELKNILSHPDDVYSYDDTYRLDRIIAALEANREGFYPGNDYYRELSDLIGLVHNKVDAISVHLNKVAFDKMAQDAEDAKNNRKTETDTKISSPVIVNEVKPEVFSPNLKNEVTAEKPVVSVGELNDVSGVSAPPVVSFVSPSYEQEKVFEKNIGIETSKPISSLSTNSSVKNSNEKPSETYGQTQRSVGSSRQPVVKPVFFESANKSATDSNKNQSILYNQVEQFDVKSGRSAKNSTNFVVDRQVSPKIFDDAESTTYENSLNIEPKSPVTDVESSKRLSSESRYLIYERGKRARSILSKLFYTVYRFLVELHSRFSSCRSFIFPTLYSEQFKKLGKTFKDFSLHGVTSKLNEMIEWVETTQTNLESVIKKKINKKKKIGSQTKMQLALAKYLKNKILPFFAKDGFYSVIVGNLDKLSVDDEGLSASDYKDYLNKITILRKGFTSALKEFNKLKNKIEIKEKQKKKNKSKKTSGRN